MNYFQIYALFVVGAFYTAYFLKMILQRRKGLKTDQMAKGANKPIKAFVIELLMKISAYLIVVVELLSVIFNFAIAKSAMAWFGLAIASVGVIIFVIAMYTMRDSWRAGIPEKDKIELVTKGIYKFSRNPAFLGFDLMYIGLLIAFFNWIHFAFVVFAVTIFHLQILQEERFLTLNFGESYIKYKNNTPRYFIL